MIWLFSLIFLAACGSADGPQTISITFKIPKSISENQNRYARFKSKALYLAISLRSESGVKWYQQFSPNQWEKIFLPEIKFPKGSSDSIRIEGSIVIKGKNDLEPDRVALKGVKEITNREYEKSTENWYEILLKQQSVLEDLD